MIGVEWYFMDSGHTSRPTSRIKEKHRIKNVPKWSRHF
jgi:hypothetical protein